MTFLCILFALLIEQLQPLRADNRIYAWVKSLALHIENWSRIKWARHGCWEWSMVVGALAIPTGLIYWVCLHISPLLAFAWNVVIVYMTLGFRHYSHYFTAIQVAFNTGDETTARSLLAEWTKQDTAGMDIAEIARHTAEQALITAHRHVFGVFFWFLVPIGPAGAVIYRVADYLAHNQHESDPRQQTGLNRCAERVFYWIDWIPVRLTAAAFAMVGNFEDAIYAWRHFARRWQDEAAGIILSVGGGAMGVRFGAPAETATKLLTVDAATASVLPEETEHTWGAAPTPRTLQRTVGLVWRALLLWMFLLLLLSVVFWLG